MSTNINFNKVLGINKGCSITLASLTQPLLLDTYSGATVAYSLRKLRTAYSGSAIRVRRSSDNAEQDFGFVGGDLDTAPMLDFVGYNLWTYSEDISQGVYIKSGLNTTGTPPYIDVETAPDSTLTGDKIIEDIFLARHYLRRASGIILNATNYNFSTYLKQGERTKVKIESQVSGTLQTCILDLTNGTVSSNGFANTPVVTAEANGWYRFSITITSGTTSASNGLTIELINPLNETVYTGDGTSGAFVWGFQISQTSTVKPYQKTVATAGGNGFVTTWYDQSGSSNNGVMNIAVNQCQVVLNGNLILDPNTNRITTIWGTKFYNFPIPFISPNTQYLTLAVINRTTTNNIFVSMGNVGGLGTANGQCPVLWRTNGNVDSSMQSLVTHGTTTTIGAYLITSEKNSANLKTVYLNNVALATTATEAPSSGTNLFYFGRQGSNYTGGRVAEFIHYSSDQSANRVAIETNIDNYWNIY